MPGRRNGSGTRKYHIELLSTCKCRKSQGRLGIGLRMLRHPSGWCSFGEYHGSGCLIHCLPRNLSRESLRGVSRASVVWNKNAMAEKAIQCRDNSPTVSPQSAMIVGPGTVPLMDRHTREKPSGAHVMLTSSK